MMARRKDASGGALRIRAPHQQEFPGVAAERSVWTMGWLKIEPNAAAIVPGYAELDLQFRDAAEAPLDALTEVASASSPK